MPEKCQLAQDFKLPLPRVSSRSDFDKYPERLFAPPISSLLTEANQELATLLQDVRNMPPIFLEGAPDVRHLKQLLTRAVDCAVKHRTLQEKLSTLAFTDELTGLYNRQAFLSLAYQQLLLARRAGREFLLFFIDVDDLKQINDAFGHSAGDQALVHTAEALVNAFRESDILARLGRDDRESVEVAGCIVEGSHNRDIAKQFSLSEETVKRNLSNIFQKTGVSTRLELALFAISRRVVKP